MATTRLYTLAELILFVVLCVVISGCFGEGGTDCEGKDTLDCVLEDGVEKNICEGKLDNCYCTDYMIQCNGSRLANIEEIYPFVSNKTKTISITRSNITELPDDMFGPLRKDNPDIDLDHFVTFTLSDNSIKKIGPSAFKNLKHLKVLDLSRNQVSNDLCSGNGFLSHLQFLEKLALRDTFDKSAAHTCKLDDMFAEHNMTKLTSLDISGNNFSSGIYKKFEKFLCNSFALAYLNMSNNNFEHIGANECMLNMRHFDMSYNKIQHISRVDMDVMESLLNVEEIRLGGNPFDCTCDTGTLVQWLNSTEIPIDAQSLVCRTSSNESYVGLKVTELDTRFVCEDPEFVVCFGTGGPIRVSKTSLYFILLAAGILLLIVTVTFFGFVIRRRNNRRRHTGGNDKTPSSTYTRMV